MLVIHNAPGWLVNEFVRQEQSGLRWGTGSYGGEIDSDRKDLCLTLTDRTPKSSGSLPEPTKDNLADFVRLIENIMGAPPSRTMDIVVARAMGWKDTLFSNFATQLEPPDAPGTATTIPHYSQPQSERDNAALWEVGIWLAQRGARISISDLGPKHSTHPGRNWLATYDTLAFLVPGDDAAAYALAVCRLVCWIEIVGEVQQ